MIRTTKTKDVRFEAGKLSGAGMSVQVQGVLHLDQHYIEDSGRRVPSTRSWSVTADIPIDFFIEDGPFSFACPGYSGLCEAESEVRLIGTGVLEGWV